MTIAGQIRAALAARLADATIANGYATDLGLHVFSGRPLLAGQDLDTGPSVALTTPKESIRDRSGNQQRIALDVEVQAAARADLPLPADVPTPTSPADVADALLGDIKRAVLRDTQLRIETVGAALSMRLEYIEADLDLPDSGEALVSVTVRFGCTYFEKYGDPAATA